MWREKNIKWVMILPIGALSVRLRLRFFVLFFFFFLRVLGQILLLRLLFMHCAWTVVTKFDLLCTVHRPTNFTFQQLFLLKMDPTVLFTRLKIILLQCFSVLIFSFQLYPNKECVEEKKISSGQWFYYPLMHLLFVT